MAGSAQYSVGAGTATSIVSAPGSPGAGATQGRPVGWFSVSNGGTVTCYLGGGTAVSSSNGYPVAASGSLQGYVFQGDNLYMIAASSTATVSVLQTGM